MATEGPYSEQYLLKNDPEFRKFKVEEAYYGDHPEFTTEQYIAEQKALQPERLQEREEVKKVIKKAAKEGAEFLVNEAINKIPGGSLVKRGVKYALKRAASSFFRTKHQRTNAYGLPRPGYYIRKSDYEGRYHARYYQRPKRYKYEGYAYSKKYGRYQYRQDWIPYEQWKRRNFK